MNNFGINRIAMHVTITNSKKTTISPLIAHPNIFFFLLLRDLFSSLITSSEFLVKLLLSSNTWI